MQIFITDNEAEQLLNILKVVYVCDGDEEAKPLYNNIKVQCGL